MNFKTQNDMTTDFHIAFDLPAPSSPTVLSDKLTINRAGYILEEVIELLHGTAGNKERFDEFYGELLDRMMLSYNKQLTKEFTEDVLVAQVDAFTDILYFGNGGFTEMGICPDPLYRIVHQANMDKIFPDGKPHYNEIGKVIKPPNWIAPEPLLEQEIRHQISLSNQNEN